MHRDVWRYGLFPRCPSRDGESLDLSVGGEIETNENLIAGTFNLGSDSFKAMVRLNNVVYEAVECVVVAAVPDHLTGRGSQFLNQPADLLHWRTDGDLGRSRQCKDSLFGSDPDLDAGRKRLEYTASSGL